MPTLSQLLVPTRDVGRSIAFYERLLGLETVMRDGDRYALLAAGGVKLALAGPSERPPEAGVAPAFRVDDLDALARALGDGAGAIRDGAHERSLELADPSGNPLVCYTAPG